MFRSRKSGRKSARNRPDCRGFSLIEVMVAVLMLAIGVLAGVKAMAAMSRMIGAGAVTTRVAVAGSNKVEGLYAAGCAVSQAGDSSFGGVRVRWNYAAGDARVVVEYPLEGRSRLDTFNLSRWCPP